ncbi:ABC transporter permease [Rhizobium sp. BK376]|uniref:ABC transporter permease n=1 Tax=Rhizobium sp. BK376 TaxID=2512149 RepID=UPI0010E1DBC3|nr:ABC transporter permease [Rhizobium sp. BK376]TCR73367.1 monosaccharide ABC transporter membrane protein (CUT2 family) [Rhizobium sp. BK376]
MQTQSEELPVAKRRWRVKVPKGSVVGLIALLLFSSLASAQFLTEPNLLNVSRQIAIVGVLAVGMTFVVLTSGIDLSVGSMMAVVAVIIAHVTKDYGAAAGIVAAILSGALLGGVNGVGVAFGRIQPFIMTLGTLAAARGLALILSGGEAIPIDADFLYELGNRKTLGVPNPTVVFLILAVVAHFILRNTVFGRGVYAIGSSEEAARLSGINVRFTKLAVYVISGVCAALAGVLYASQLGVGSGTAGDGSELDAIAATVVGGTSLFGGQGTIAGTFVGAAILGVLANILNLTGVDPFLQRIARGVLIVIAVLLQGLGQRRK